MDPLAMYPRSALLPRESSWRWPRILGHRQRGGGTRVSVDMCSHRREGSLAAAAPVSLICADRVPFRTVMTAARRRAADRGAPPLRAPWRLLELERNRRDH